MKSRFSIVIVGGGITGLAVAARLAQGPQASALDIRLVDVAKRPQFAISENVALRVSAMANGSVEFLESVGAWDAVRALRISPFERMRVWDESDTPDSPSALSFDAAEFALPQLGFIVENLAIQDALLKVLDSTNVKLEFETELDELPQADLLIGADGARSFVRDRAGIQTNKWPYEQTALVTHLAPELDHERVAWQRFLRTGPLGMLPLGDGRISVVWSTSPDIAKQALNASDVELGRMLSAASDGVLGKLEVAGPKGAYPLCAQHAEQYIKPGVALIGDAAHAIHPLAGQGANLGLQDAAELARVIEDAMDAGLHPGDRPVLRRYERARKGANLTMLHFMTGLNRLFTTDSALIGEIRSAGMRLFNRSGPIKERAVRVALGVN